MRPSSLIVATLVLLAMPNPGYAQTAEQLQALRSNPQLVRQRIQQSGLTPEQIRDRLRAAGYSASLLDSFFSTGPAASGVTSDDAMLAALSVLEVDPVMPEGIEPISVAEGVEAPTRVDAPGRLRLFGLDVFRGRTPQFQPLLAGPVPSNYRIGPGDVMVVVLTGDVEFVYELAVTREGFIVIPQVGQIYVNSLTMAQLRQLLTQRLGQSYSGIRTGTTQFDVTIARLRTNQVFAIGEVQQPGAYQLASVATVLNALYAAGGPTERGNFRAVEVRRRGDSIVTFDLYDYLLRGDTRNDIMLEQGDIVFVPVLKKRVTVDGAVVRPAIYELNPEETLADLVEAAGGFRADAALNRVSVSRIIPPANRRPDGPERMVVDVPLDHTDNGTVPPFALEPGDVVTAFAVANARGSLVELNGNVYHPGRYGWEPGMRLSELIELAGGFRPAVYAGRAHIERLNAADSTRYLVNVELPSDSVQPYPDDVPLEEFDVVTVYGRDEFRTRRTVAIGGMVNQAGEYPYRNGMTVRDLVLMARGLRDGASLDTAEVARLPADRSGGVTAVGIRVPIDSTYLFEPDSTSYPRLPGPPTRSTDAPEVPLEPFDRVTILRQPEFELLRTVRIIGEVRYPRPYALRRRNERLGDLIARAGGLTETGYADGFRFYRGGNLVNVELQQVLRNPNHRDNVTLLPGDSMIVPEYNPVVVVQGAVNSPSTVLFRSGAGLGYYIDNAGGYAENADKGRSHVRYANGSIRVKHRFLFFGSSPEPGPASTVIVPAKREGQGTDIRGIFSDIAQIVVAGVTLAIVALR